MMAHESGIARASSGDGRTGWLRAIRLYLAAILAANLVWEIVQLPLYTIWQEATVPELAFAIVHCTVGDLLIAAACLILALGLSGSAAWPSDWTTFRRVAMIAVALGIAYTIYSEWLNVRVLATWEYTAAMPVLPPLQTGVAPLLQWIVIPPVAFRLTWRKVSALRQAAAKQGSEASTV